MVAVVAQSVRVISLLADSMEIKSRPRQTLLVNTGSERSIAKRLVTQVTVGVARKETFTSKWL